MDADPAEVLGEEPAGSDLTIVVGAGVHPCLALDDRGMSNVAGSLPHRDSQQQDHERPVEEQAPDLPGDPLLGGNLGVSGGRSERLTGQDAARGSQHRGGLGVHVHLPVEREGVDLAGLDRLLARAADGRPGAGDQTREQGHEQQRRDQGEPPRTEDVEELSLLVEETQHGVVGQEPGHALG